MKINIAIFIFLILIAKSYSQTSFEYMFGSPLNEISRSIIEDDEGNTYYAIKNYQYALIIKLDRFGTFVDSLSIYNQDGTCNLEELVKIDSNYFAAVGNWTVDTASELWFVKISYELEIIEESRIDTQGEYIYEFHHILNHIDNIVLLGHYQPETNEDVCLLEITKTGILVRSAYYNTNLVFNEGYSILEDYRDSTYKVFTHMPLNSKMRVLVRMNRIDSNFNLINYIQVPSTEIDSPVSAEWLDDSTFLLTGRLYNWELHNWDVGILKMTNSDSILSSSYFGGEHTDEWPAIYDALDFISPDNIFFAGSSNSYFYPFQAEPSWIMLNILDADLSLKNQRYYGGDAYYLVNSILATQDSGCVLSCSRYDYTVQNEEFDVYILKVDQEGLLVSVPGEPVINEGICYLYPNPGTDFLAINSARDGLRMELFDLTSKLELSQTLQQGMNTVAVQGLAPGVYLYRIMDKLGNIIQSGKWIKMRE